MLCKVMGVNRSGYYKWRKRQGTENRYIRDRRLLTELILERHRKHKVWGYHSIATSIRNDTGWKFSDNLVHKCCKAAGVKSKAKRYRYRKPGEESEIFLNLVRGCWVAARPLEIVVSDMTCIRCNGKLYEWVLFIDTFNNEIIAHSVSAHRGDPKTYYNCLDQLCKRVKNVKEQTAGTVLHTDQGAVYSSRAFSRAHSNYNIIRSMSRAGTPTDNPIIESLNGWMKAELILDFGISKVSNFKKHWINMSNTLTLNVLLPPWITKPQSSTGLNWGSETMLFYSCLLLLDRCTRLYWGGCFFVQCSAGDSMTECAFDQRISCCF